MYERHLPPLDLAEVEGDSPVGQCLLIEVLGVTPDERRHIIACIQYEI